MPNKRAEGQRLINVPMDEDFIEQIDGNLAALGYDNRSSFIRDAIVEKLIEMGVRVPRSITVAPARTRGAYPQHVPASITMNEPVSSKQPSAVERIAAAHAPAAVRRALRSERKQKAAAPSAGKGGPKGGAGGV